MTFNALPQAQTHDLDHLPSWYWWFQNRIHFAADLIDGKPVRRWVDLGPGPGGTTRELMNVLVGRRMADDLTEVFGVEADLSLHQRLIANRITPVMADLDRDQLPIPKNFDLFTAFDVLEHLQNPVGLLKQIRLAAAPGALGIITVPAMSGLWSHWDVAMSHQRRYSKKLLVTHLTEAGFKVRCCRHIFSWAYLPALARKYRLKNIDPSNINHEFPKVSSATNTVLKTLSQIEWRLPPLPFGTSLIAGVSA